MTIWKYEIPHSGEFTLELPLGATPVHIAPQDAHSQPFMWVLCNPHLPRVPQLFFLASTGDEIDMERWCYVGTVVFRDRFRVDHLFMANTHL